MFHPNALSPYKIKPALSTRLFLIYENARGGGEVSGKFSKNRLFIIQFFFFLRQIVPAFLTFFNGTIQLLFHIIPQYRFTVERTVGTSLWFKQASVLFHIVRLASHILSSLSTLDSHNLLYTKSPILFLSYGIYNWFYFPPLGPFANKEW
jgi:hypothetical protein